MCVCEREGRIREVGSLDVCVCVCWCVLCACVYEGGVMEEGSLCVWVCVCVRVYAHVRGWGQGGGEEDG